VRPSRSGESSRKAIERKERPGARTDNVEEGSGTGQKCKGEEHLKVKQINSIISEGNKHSSNEQESPHYILKELKKIPQDLPVKTRFTLKYLTE